MTEVDTPRAPAELETFVDDDDEHAADGSPVLRPQPSYGRYGEDHPAPVAAPQIDWEADLGVELDLLVQVDGTAPGAAARRVALEAALDAAETVTRLPTPAESGNPVGRTDAGAQDGRQPDPRPGGPDPGARRVPGRAPAPGEER